MSRQVVPNLFLSYPWATWVLCSVICQQRWLWRAPLVAAAAVIGRIRHDMAIPRAVVEDFFEHSYHSALHCMTKCIVETPPCPAPHPLHEAVVRLRDNGGVRMTVIHGAEDGMIPIEIGQRLAQKCGARFVPIPDSGHMCPLDSEGGIKEVVRTLAKEVGRHRRL